MKKEIQKELSEIAPKLAAIKKRKNPEVPAGYFEGLADEIMEKVKTADSHTDVELQPKAGKAHILSIIHSPISLGIAAAFVLLFAALQIFQWNGGQSSLELSDTEIIAYLDQNLDQLDPELLMEYELLDESDISFLAIGEGQINDSYYEEILNELDDETIENVLF